MASPIPMKLKSAIFWAHLISGIICGVVIAIMSFTGAMLAFQTELIAWAEGDLRKAEPPAATSEHLPIIDLLSLAAKQRPDFTPATIAFDHDPSAICILSSGGRGATILYQNPYTGEVRDPGAPRMRAFMNIMFIWHRWLGLGGEARATGKAITGACNAAFVVLVITGFYLWWPRSWKWKHMRPSTVIQTRLRGRARDWNWHNAIGFWCAPILLVLTVTALPISYQWASNLIYQAFGEEVPTRQGPPTTSTPDLVVTPPTPDSQALSLDALFARAKEQLLGWEKITLITAPPKSRQGPREGNASGSTTASTGKLQNTAPTASAVPLTVRENSRWPRTATVQAHFNPYTGELMRRDTFADNSPARRLRTWTRFLHTGEALGWPGQLLAGLASLGALVLCYTGFALTWRRFFHRPKASRETTALSHEHQPENETTATP